MPANFESGVFARGLSAWHGAGVTLPDDAMDYDTIVRHVREIDMPVSPRQLVYLDADNRPHVVPDQVANVRSDGTYLGVVGDGYQAVQGREAFEFLSALLKPTGDGIREVIADTAGTLDGGRKLFIACRAGREFYVAGQNEERHDGYLTFLNSFDGSTHVGACVSTVRTVCQNTFNANLQTNKASYWFKHIGNVMDRLDEARQALTVAGRYWKEYETRMNQLVRVKWGTQEWNNLLDHLVADPRELEQAGKARAAQNAERERGELTMLWVNAPDVQNIKGTAYAAVQAVTAYNDHMVRGRKSDMNTVAENRARRIMLDTSLKEKAYKAICQMAEIR